MSDPENAGVRHASILPKIFSRRRFLGSTSVAVATALSLMALLLAQSAPAQSTADQRFGTLIADHWQWVERDNPERATLRGDNRYNDRLIERGYARFLVIPPNGAHARAMLSAELAARAAGRGLWGAC